VLRGNLFDSAAHEDQRDIQGIPRPLSGQSQDPMRSRTRDRVRGPEDYHHRIDDPALDIDEHASCSCAHRSDRYPGGAEVVKAAPAALIKRGILSLPCIGDGRNPAPQARRRSSTPRPKPLPTAACDPPRPATWSGRPQQGNANILISDEELKRVAPNSRPRRLPYPANQTPWQELYRSPSASRPPAHAWKLATPLSRHRPAWSAWRG